MIRKPAVADRFYTSNEIILRTELSSYMTNAEPKKAMAVVSPHAGYPYSGKTAGAVYSEVIVPKSVIVMGPNHWGAGSAFATMTEGAWETPFGDMAIDSVLAEKIIQNCDFLESDDSAHAREHSIEVQLPFLQHRNPEVSFVPIMIYSNDLEKFKSLGKAIASAIKEMSTDVLIVASTDMSHTKNSSASLQKTMKKLDMSAIEKIEALNTDDFMHTVMNEKITMCGYGAVATAIAASKELGASKGTLIRYSTSYDISGDYSYVVGYAGIVID